MQWLKHLPAGSINIMPMPLNFDVTKRGWIHGTSDLPFFLLSITGLCEHTYVYFTIPLLAIIHTIFVPHHPHPPTPIQIVCICFRNMFSRPIFTYVLMIKIGRGPAWRLAWVMQCVTWYMLPLIDCRVEKTHFFN